MENAICPFCDAPYTDEMLTAIDGTYGCDSGCEFYRVYVECEACGKTLYVKGEFGDTHYTDSNWREDVTEKDIKEAIERKREDW
jgi:hypothetical protein